MRPMTVWLTPFFTAWKENIHVMYLEVSGGRSNSHLLGYGAVLWHNNQNNDCNQWTISSCNKCHRQQHLRSWLMWRWPLSIKRYSAHPHNETPFTSTLSFIYCPPHLNLSLTLITQRLQQSQSFTGLQGGFWCLAHDYFFIPLPKHGHEEVMTV